MLRSVITLGQEIDEERIRLEEEGESESENKDDNESYYDSLSDSEWCDFGDILAGRKNIWAITANLAYKSYNCSIFSVPMEKVQCQFPRPNPLLFILKSTSMVKLPAATVNFMEPLDEY